MISLANARQYFGPSVFADDPVITVNLRIEPADGQDPAANAARMTQAFGAWFSGASKRPEESPELFVARYLVEWSLAALNEFRGFLHVCGARQNDNGIIAWLGYHDSELSLECLNLAAQFFTETSKGGLDRGRTNQTMQQFWEKCRQHHPDYQAKILMEAARAKNLPYLPFFLNLKIWQFGWGNRSVRFYESSSEEDSAQGARIAGDKVLSKIYLQSLGAPISRHVMVKDEANLPAAAEKLGWPCVVKPIDRGQARGVSVNITNLTELKRAFAKARAVSSASIMIESHVEGDVHRLLVVRGKFVAATRRDPAEVTGNGRSTILALADAFNETRTASATPGSYMGPVPFDEDFDTTLAKQGYDRSSIPAAGAKIRLRAIPLQGTGAANTDVSHLVHPDIKFMVEVLAETLCLKVVGFDYLTPDISRSCEEVGKFLEINLCPSLRGHLENDRDVRGIADIILGPRPARIPSMLVIASEDWVQNHGGELAVDNALGWRCGGHVGVGSMRLHTDSYHPIAAMRALLLNTAVSRLLIVYTPKELASFGMPLDRVDVVVANEKQLDERWLEVLRRNSAEFIPVNAPEQLQQTIGQHLPKGPL